MIRIQDQEKQLIEKQNIYVKKVYEVIEFFYLDILEEEVFMIQNYLIDGLIVIVLKGEWMIIGRYMYK